MKFLLALFICGLWSFAGLAQNYVIDKEKSTVDWHFPFQSDTNVYGSIPISKGTLQESEGAASGEIIFGLKETKSYELEKNEKQFSDSRDGRIYKITGAKKKAPVFKLSKVTPEGLTENGAQPVLVQGVLALNGVEQKVEMKGQLTRTESTLVFDGEYALDWRSFKISNPVMWFMRALAKAEKNINVKFHIEARAK